MCGSQVKQEGMPGSHTSTPSSSKGCVGLLELVAGCVSSKVSASEAKAGPSGCRSSNAGATGLANCMRLMAVRRKACKCSDMMVGPARLLAKRSCAKFLASSRCWCHQNLGKEASAVGVSDAMGIS